MKKISAVKTFFVNQQLVKNLDWKSRFKPRENFQKYYKAGQFIDSTNA